MCEFELIPVTTQLQLDTCLMIRNEVFILEKRVAREIEVDANDVLFSGCEHFLFEYAGNAVGACRCLVQEKTTLRLQRFCVRWPYRGTGIAKQALFAVEAHYRAQGFSRVELDAKHNASGFYLSCGYDICSAPFLDVNFC